MNKLLNIPEVPTRDAASTGENTKDERVPPTIVAFRQLVNPNYKSKECSLFRSAEK